MIRALLPISLGVVWFIVTAWAASAQQAATSDINLMSFANGALVERSSSVYGDSWDPFLLIMENPSRGWANAEGAQPPFETVISVPNRSEFRRFLFDTASAESPERAAKTVDIQISDDGKVFRPVMTVDLAAGADNQDFTPPHAVQGQYVKLVVRSNHGDDKYWELFNTRALGVPLEDRRCRTSPAPMRARPTANSICCKKGRS